MTNDFPALVKAWLRQEGRNNQWLADQCDVKLSAVYSWFSSRGFPEDKQRLIESLMEKGEALAKTSQNLVLDFTQDEFDLICIAASKKTQLPRVWAKDRLLELVEMDANQMGALIDEMQAQEYLPPLSNITDPAAEAELEKKRQWWRGQR